MYPRSYPPAQWLWRRGTLGLGALEPSLEWAPRRARSGVWGRQGLGFCPMALGGQKEGSKDESKAPPHLKLIPEITKGLEVM